MNTLTSLLRQALHRRRSFLDPAAREITNCFRAFDGINDGAEGLVVEVFGQVAIIQVYEGKLEWDHDALIAVAQWCLSQMNCRAAYLKVFVADRSHVAAPLMTSEPFAGLAVESEIVGRENGVDYYLRPYDGYSVGLFLDQRENRQALATGVAGLKVLNCFSYTGGFSVACARGGAITTSVDVSTKYLNWGKRNFELNGLDPLGHRFFARDVLDYLAWAVKRGERFDLIILDPPSFGRPKKGPAFSLKRDAVKLLEACLELLNPGGRIFFSTNYSGWNQAEVVALARAAWAGRRWAPLAVPAVPLDFAGAQTPIRYVLAQF